MQQNAVTGRRVVVTGIGAVSALGGTLATTWAALIAGKTGIAPITRFDARDFPTTFAAQVKNDDQDRHRVVAFAIAAAREAIRASGINPTRANARMATIIGTALGDVEALSADIRLLDEQGPRAVTSLPLIGDLADTVARNITANGQTLAIASSFTSGANAIGEGAHMIATGRADIALVGGTEAPICPVVLAGFAAMGALSSTNDDPTHAIRPFDRHRNGCVLGEGAAMLILEERDRAIVRGAPIISEVAGYANTNDAFHQVALPDDGEGLVMAMRQALANAAIRPDLVGYLNAHGTATEMNDRVEAAAIHEVFGPTPPPVSSTKAATGHTLGAAGAIEAVFAIMALATGALPPTLNHREDDPGIALDVIPNTARHQAIRASVSNSMGFGGHNTVLVFTANDFAS